jgi:hypothetical protein
VFVLFPPSDRARINLPDTLEPGIALLQRRFFWIPINWIGGISQGHHVSPISHSMQKSHIFLKITALSNLLKTFKNIFIYA